MNGLKEASGSRETVVLLSWTKRMMESMECPGVAQEEMGLQQ